MKSLILAFALLPTFSYASSLDCRAPSVQYHEEHNDGGAFLAPTYLLKLRGRALIDVRPFRDERQNVRSARFELVGSPSRRQGPFLKDFYETKQFVQTARIYSASSGEDRIPVVILWQGPVRCADVRYVGPPRP